MSPVTCPDRNLQWVMGRAVAVAVLALSLVGPLSASAQPAAAGPTIAGVPTINLGGVLVASLPDPFIYPAVAENGDIGVWVSTAEIAVELREAVKGARSEFWEAVYGRKATGPEAQAYRKALEAFNSANGTVKAVSDLLRDTPGGVGGELNAALADLDAAETIAAELKGSLASRAPVDAELLRRRVDDLSLRLASGVRTLKAGRERFAAATTSLKSADEQLSSGIRTMDDIRRKVDGVQDELDRIGAFGGRAADAIWGLQFAQKQWGTETDAQLQKAQELLSTLQEWTRGTAPPAEGWDTEEVVVLLAALSELQRSAGPTAANKHAWVDLSKLWRLLRGEHIASGALFRAKVLISAWAMAKLRVRVWEDVGTFARRIARATGLTPGRAAELIRQSQ